MASYTYSNSTDFINASTIILSEVQLEIENSSISSANVLYLIESGDSIIIYFDGTLSGGDQTTLLGIVNAYTTGPPSESLVTDNGSFNLSNKNLLTDSNYFVDPVDNTKRIGFSTVSNNTNTTLSFSSQTTANRTITFPDISDTAVTLTASQILTNKTINNIKIEGTGNTTSTLSTAYIQPASTTVTGSNNYFFTYLGQPITSGSTTGSAYTVYIQNAPSGTITNPYALYVNTGKTYIGGSLQIPTGAQNGYLLRSDGSGNTSWVSPSGLGSTFSDGTSSLPGIAFTSELGTGFYRPSSGQIGVSLNGASYILFKTTGTDFVTGSTVNVGTSGTTSPLNVFGLITGNNGLTISSGTSALQAVTSTTINASGLITGTNGLTITGANSSLTTLSTSGLITANAGINVTNGQILNVGTSGSTSSLNIYGQTDFLGVGSTVASSSTVYIAPASTAVSGANNYNFTYFAQPITSGSTTGSAYTIYIDNAPSGTITNPYALYVNTGKTYIGGALQIPTGAQNGYLLRSDGSGNVSWVAPSGLGTSFSDGTSSLPGIAFTSELGTGFYRPSSGQIGVSLNGASYILFKTTGTDFVTGSTVNVGTSGTTSPLNVFGLITGNNGLTISSGTSALQAVTSTTINASGLITGTNGLTITGANSSLTTLSTSGLISANGGITSSNGNTVNVGTSGTTSPLNVFGLITGNNGLTISSGTTALQAVTSTTINASGLITGTNGLTITGANSSLTTLSTSGLISANGGITSSNGNTVNVGTSGTTSPLNVFGLITGNNGLTISSGTSALQAVTSTTINASGLISANAGINVANGQILNVGTSGTTSSLNIYGQTDFLGVGSSVVSSANVYIAPSSTSITGANNYYFTYLAQPATSGTTTGSAYTLYIDNAPSGTITTPYAFYVNAGKTYIGDTLQIPTGASNGAVLTSDASGNASWSSPGVAYNNATVSSTITTTSTTPVNIAGMTLTPPAGTYYFVFTGVGSVNNNSRGFNVRFAKNGVFETGSLMTILTTTAQSVVTTSFVISCNGGDNISVQWFISNGAGTLTLFTQRSLTALKLSP